jgi:DNA-binding transcriptional ArsR family regulator
MVHLKVNDSFKAIASPIRRRIVERLANGPATVGEATSGLGVTKPAITKHLRVLEEAGLVTRVIDGRVHRLRLEVDALDETSEWISLLRVRWQGLFDAVEEYLEESKENR